MSGMRTALALIVAILSVLSAVALAAPQHAQSFRQRLRYDNHRLMRVRALSQSALEDLQGIVGETPDVWNTDGAFAADIDMDIMFSPAQFRSLEAKFAERTDLQRTTLHDNVQQMVAQEAESILAKKRFSAATDSPMSYFDTYRDFNETIEYVNSLVARFNNLAYTFSIGESWQKRDLLVVHVTSDRSANKPAVWFNSMQHAREWIGVPVTTWALKNLLEGYGNDEKITALLDKVDIYFMPMLNPDGYEVTWRKDRLWRKNMRDNGRGIFGVDLNRNWPDGFGVGASSDPRSLTYKGPSPISEPESSALFKFFTEKKNTIKAAIDFHSYSQLILRPYGYQRQTSAHEHILKPLGAKMQQDIKNTTGERYQNIRAIQLYAAGGCLCDCFYESFGFMGYTIELRDTGRYGFVLPDSYIKPTIEENYKAILTLIEHVADGKM